MTSIEWTDATWNPIAGCSIVSPGCTNCYAMKMAARLERMNPALEHYRGLTQPSKAGPVWTGKVALAPEHILSAPLRWKKPRRVFVNSMSDLFYEDVPDAWIDRIFAVMALAPQHTFQILTKRSKRMREYMSNPQAPGRVWLQTDIIADHGKLAALAANGAAWGGQEPWPLVNVWLGISAEDQTRADERIPDLLDTPSALRFVSAEPLLSDIQFNYVSQDRQRQSNWLTGETGRMFRDGPDFDQGPRLDWIIVGGESGPGARPMHPDWARSIRDQCAAAGVPFFFKQWGVWAPGEVAGLNKRAIDAAKWLVDRWLYQRCGKAQEDDHIDDEPTVFRIGKARAGRLLDGVTHDAFPETRQ